MSGDDRRWLAVIAHDMAAMVFCLVFPVAVVASVCLALGLTNSFASALSGLAGAAGILGFVTWHKRIEKEEEERKKTE